MPYSAGENIDDLLEFIKDKSIKGVLDIGPGAGTYGKALRPHTRYIDAVEIYEPYIEMFGLEDIYDYVTVGDARDLDIGDGMYDMVIFGDVLEHMTKEESLAPWQKSSVAKYAVISVPIVHYPQGESYGNPHEVHVQEHMHPEDIEKDYGPFVFSNLYDVTGMFIKEWN